MLTYENILNATTKFLSDNTDIEDVFIDDVEGVFNKECFYVSIVPLSVQASTSSTDKKELIISVKYYGGNKLKCYDMANKLNNLFNRILKVNNRTLTVSNTEPNIFNDEVGTVLDFLISVSYFDDIKRDLIKYEYMKDLYLNTKCEVK